MAKRTNKLTDTAVKNAKPRAGEKPGARKIFDGGGLFLLVTPSGGKHWKLKFRDTGAEQQLALGSYPEMSLSDARDRRDAARKVIKAGGNPAREKQQRKHRAKISADNTFGGIAKEFIEKRKREGLGEATAEKAQWYLDRLSPDFQRTSIAKIEPPDLLAQLRKIEARGRYETAKRVFQLSGRVFRYAVASARLASDPSRDLAGALTRPRPKSFAAITEPKKVGELLRAIDGFEGTALVRIALQLAPHVFVRPGELRHAEWKEIDLDGAVWTIPAGKSKMRKEHRVYLSRQAVALLRKAREISGPEGFVFPSIRTRLRPMSENTITASLRRLGYASGEVTGHGFRSTASTLLNESGKWNPDLIEASLAHGDSDKVRGIYNRAEYRERRAAMAQWWSDHLDLLRSGGAEIVPLSSKREA